MARSSGLNKKAGGTEWCRPFFLSAHTDATLHGRGHARGWRAI